MDGQLDKRMLHWQPATCCIFQLFIIICYLANKVLLLLLLLLLQSVRYAISTYPAISRSLTKRSYPTLRCKIRPSCNFHLQQ